MQGMMLARAYFETYGRAMIDEQFASYKPYMAVGLVGEGSECFGYDDALSVDHDYGPGFCIWLPELIHRQVGDALQQAYERLPKNFGGHRRMETPQAGKRVGVWSIEQFYEKYTGLVHPPRDNMEWFKIPESFLAVATNGQVFWDQPGMFTEWRNVLLRFYPEDVVKKKLAAKCAFMAQSGQYNYGRSMKRGDRYAAYLACNLFVQNALAAIYLLNECYAPYYKWLFRGTESLRSLTGAVEKLKVLTELSDSPEQAPEKERLINSVCDDMVQALNNRGWTKTSASFLQHQAEELMRSIGDNRLRALHIMADV